MRSALVVNRVHRPPFLLAYAKCVGPHHGSPFCQDALRLQQPRYSRMHLGWCIQRGQKCLPLFGIHLAALPIRQGFGSAGQSARQQKVDLAWLGRPLPRRRTLKRLLGSWRQPPDQLFRSVMGMT